MAIFNKPDQQTDIQTHSTVISASTRIEGKINSRSALHIDGSLQGIVDADGTVTVGHSGKIYGDLSANKLTVIGLFQGTADCENIEILAGGSLKGKVISNNLTIDQNCTFEGESVKKSRANTAKQPTLPQESAKNLPTDLPKVS